ncbi:PDC sensor domain-containing protein [Campylobacter californiensis]|uniref:hypothetical protein n=1 Tax=Campylobacter californiensis TaxID=1032243 RepID=UPI001D14B767|nr:MULTISPECIES: hypothetical protein [unclassified Campylobacter]
MPKHAILEQETLNFCVPNFYEGEFNAVLCGVVKLQSLFEKIKNFKLSPNSYSFVITNGGEILTPMKDNSLKPQIQENFKELYLNKNNTKILNIGSNFISFSEIKYLNWFVGAGVDNEKEIDNLLNDISKNAALLLCGFLVLSLLANFLHNFMYNKINARKKEYEILLMHKAKMSEIGELLSGINHQFIQPVNSLRLITTTINALKKDGHLSDEKLEVMLKNQEKSIMLLGDTIEIFRNFYKTNENISKFSIKRSIKNLLTLMHTELSRANVGVVLEEFEDRNISQVENIIQQILLILIHNAKDAVVEKFKDDFKSRVISISVKFDEKYCYIKVSEFGC